MRIALSSTGGRLLISRPEDIYFIEAEGDETLVRTARKTKFRSSTGLSDWAERLRDVGFVRVHRSFLVNIDRIREVRLRRGDPNDRELRLDPPVNTIIPVSREGYRVLQERLLF